MVDQCTIYMQIVQETPWACSSQCIASMTRQLIRWSKTLCTRFKGADLVPEASTWVGTGKRGKPRQAFSRKSAERLFRTHDLVTHWDSFHHCTRPALPKGRPSAGGSHMSVVWGREKPRQASSVKSTERLLQTRDLVTQWDSSHHYTWWLSETALTIH